MDQKPIEIRVKRRGWIKNAVIIFLAVMLVLTLFSNTIMNRSLPEVATQYVTSGTISAKIRGSGTVKANSSFEVKIKENRVVKTVAVRKGDTVEVGDTLFILGEATESSGLDALLEELENAKYAYREKLLNAPNVDYTRDNLSISRQKETIEDLKKERDLLYTTEEQISNAERTVTERQQALQQIQDSIDLINDRIAKLTEEITSLGGSVGGGGGEGVPASASSLLTAIDKAWQALREAEIARETAYLQYGDTVEELYEATKNDPEDSTNKKYTVDTYNEYEKYFYYSFTDRTIAAMQAYANLNAPYSAASGDEKDEDEEIEGVTVTDNTSTDQPNYALALNALKTAETTVKTAQETYNNAQKAYNDYINNENNASQNAAKIKDLEVKLKAAKDELGVAEKNKTKAETALETAKTFVETLKSNKEAYKTAAAAVKSAEDSLENLLLDLQDSQLSGGKQNSQYALEIERMKTAVTELEEKIAKYESGGEVGDTIVSQVAGVVTSIDISAGSTTEYDVPMMTIEEKDRGYMVSMSVTNEQAQKVRIGDPADVTSYYWGSKITATLVSITNNPESPGQSKLLNFMLDGEVTTGDQLTLSIGEKSAQYELTVPNSAVRSDANGSFVLIVTSKSSPLGNRYVATRIDVQVIAQDDKNAAISGAVGNYDSVITTTSAPVSPGDLIRLVSN